MKKGDIVIRLDHSNDFTVGKEYVVIDTWDGMLHVIDDGDLRRRRQSEFELRHTFMHGAEEYEEIIQAIEIMEGL